MVMEAPPSPQSVGREFVRQYYTLLNKAPNHLHRFYNHQSSFVHGGLDHPNRETQPVIGQKEIHHKIQQLNFRDCHAKITQVDSQSTLGNGVVVQVTGELSNAGQPMRRFTQTFVLAAQSPKKYYVHNDIFRYQDEIISDEECDQDSRSENDDEVVGAVTPQQEQVVCVEPQQPQQHQQPIQITPTAAPFYPSPAAAVPLGAVPPAAVAGGVVPQGMPVTHVGLNGHPEDVAVYGQGVVPTSVQPLVQQKQPPLTANVTAPSAHTTLPPPQQIPPQPLIQQAAQIIPQQQPPILAQQTIPAAPVEQFPEQPPTLQPPPQQQQDQPQDMYSSMQYGISSHQQESSIGEEIPANDDANELSQEEESVGESLTMQQQSPPQQQPPQVSNEPKTYAYLLKSSSYSVNVTRSVSPPQQQQQHFGGGQQRLGGGGNVRMGNGRPSGGSGFGRTSDGNKSGRGSLINNEDDERIRRNSGQNSSSAPSSTMSSSTFVGDQFQLFVGNLPHAATEDELRDIFSSYGTVLDLKVLSKAGNIAANKGMQQGGGRGPPNYGFVTYDSYQSVQRCLRAKPIYYPKDDKNGSVVNVEEKKMKERSSFGGNGGGGGGRPSLPPQQMYPPHDNNRSSNNGPQQRRMGGGGPMGGRPPMMGGGGISAGGNMNNRNNNGYSNNSGGGRMGGRGGYNNNNRR